MRTDSILIGLAGLAGALVMVSGCSDDPAHQADRQAQQKTAEAMDLYLYKGTARGPEPVWMRLCRSGAAV